MVGKSYLFKLYIYAFGCQPTLGILYTIASKTIKRVAVGTFCGFEVPTEGRLLRLGDMSVYLY